MPDNPRSQDQHTDIPSSRHSAGVPNPAGSSPGGSYSTPPPQHGGTPPSKIHLRNIIIGSVVTIITSTIIFYLTQYLKRPEGGEFQRKKNATTAAWKSYVGYENVYAQNTISYKDEAQTKGLDAYLEGVKKESADFIKDIQDLQKRKYLDEDLLKVFSKRIENEKTTLPLVEEYFRKMTAIDNSNQSLKEKKDAWTHEMIQYNITVNGMYHRSVNELKGIAKLLAERYGGSFSENDFVSVQMAPQMMKTNDSMVLVLMNVIMDSAGNIIENKNFAVNVNPNNLVGKWTIEGAEITLAKDGKMIWLVANGSKAEGTWKLEKDKLKIQATTTPENKKVTWLFNLAYITANSFTMVLDTSPYNLYRLVRTVEN